MSFPFNPGTRSWLFWKLDCIMAVTRCCTISSILASTGGETSIGGVAIHLCGGSSSEL